MAAYSVKQKYLVDNYAVLVLLTPGEIEVGASITVSGVDGFNGNHTVYALPQYLYTGTDPQGDLILDPLVPIENQVLFALTAANVARVASGGTLTYSPVCTWIDATDIQDWLGIVAATAGDEAFLDICASAASQFAWRRRMESGYIDSLGVAPSDDVKLGTVMYGGGLYRQRGSVDNFASYSDMGNVPVPGLNGMIKQLLGISRPAVA